MDRDTAAYEAEFAADDQEELNGAEVGEWPHPKEIAEKVAIFWNDAMLSLDADTDSEDPFASID
jgi:hypothetical protein